jgi:protein-tyrosine phosphatase
MTTILFVCTANRYRSPLAAACFRKELSTRKPGEKWHILSAGTWADDGMPAASGAIAAARRLGLNIADHRSRNIDAPLIESSDLIIAMEQGQVEALRSEFPSSAPKLHLLSEVASGLKFDIPDPAWPAEGGGVDTELSEMVHTGFDRICALAEGK